MIRKDYIERILEQLNKFVLAIAGHKTKEEFELALDQANEAYDSFNIEKRFILNSDHAELIKELSAKRFSSQEIEKLGLILKEEADIWFIKHEPDKALTFYKKSLGILQLLSEKDKTYSFDREKCISNIHTIIATHFS